MTVDVVAEAYDRGDFPVQPPCPCCKDYTDGGCAAVVESERTGRCVMYRLSNHALGAGQCDCYGSIADGGLCEDCYVSTK